MDEILERVQNKFIADGDVEFAAPKAGTANALKAEIEAQIAAQREAETRGSARETMVPAGARDLSGGEAASTLEGGRGGKTSCREANFRASRGEVLTGPVHISFCTS